MIFELCGLTMSPDSQPPACRAGAEGEGEAMTDRLIAGLWLALIIGMPAVAGAGSFPIGLGLFLVIFLASGVAPAIHLGLKVKTRS